MKWIRVVNLRLGPGVIPFAIGLMMVVTLAAIVVTLWRGQFVNIVLQRAVVPIHVSITYLLGLALARGRITVATLFTAEAIPIPAIWLLYISLGQINDFEWHMKIFIAIMLLVLIVLHWYIASFDLREAMQRPEDKAIQRLQSKQEENTP